MFEQILPNNNESAIEIFPKFFLRYTPVRLSLSARFISRGTVFFSHSKSATADL
jgi:hypothetical protein